MSDVGSSHFLSKPTPQINIINIKYFIFCRGIFYYLNYFDVIFSILDDGVLSHKEFVVVMKNQLVRGLENVIIFVKENILTFKN